MDDALEDNDLFQTIKDWFKQSRTDSSNWREEAEEDFQFVAGHQFTDEEKQMLKDQMRPAVVFNRCGTIIDSISGMEVNNRQEIKFIPRREGSSGVNEVLTGATNWFRDQSNAEDEESDAFRDAVICGMGWTDTRLNFEDDPEGKTEDERVDPLEMYWDTTNKRKNLLGGRFVMRLKRDICLDDAKAMFPDVMEEDLNASWISTGSSGTTIKKDPSESYNTSSSERSGNKSEKVQILEVQWWDREEYYKVVDPATMDIQELSEEEYTIANERYMEASGSSLEAVRLTRKKYKQAFVGAVVLEEKDCPAKDRFTFQCITGKRDNKSNTYYGIVRPMKDPQRWANKWLSQVMHIINSNSKGGLLAETGAFENIRKAKAEWSDPNSMTLLKEGGLAKIREKNPITYPAGLDQLMQFAISSIRDVSGVNMEMIGMADREQSGVVEMHRKKAAMTVLATLFDSLRLMRKEKGKIYLEYIQNYLSNGRLVRIVGKNGEQFIPLVRDPSVTDYEVVVDEAPASPNQKDQVWAFMIQMLPMLKDKMTPQIWAEIIPYSPLPEALTQKISKMIIDSASQPNPKAERAAKIAEDMQVATIGAIKAEAAKDASSAELNIVKAKTEKVKTFVDAFGTAHKAIKQ